MSKRFGRGQKRKMRAEIAAGEARSAAAIEALSLNMQRYILQESKLQKAQEDLLFLKTAIIRLCPDSSLLEPKTKEYAAPHGRGPMMQRRQRVSFSYPPPSKAGSAASTESIEGIPTWAFETMAVRNPERFITAVHCIARHTKGSIENYAYCVSDEAIASEAVPARLIEEIGRQVAGAMFAQLIDKARGLLSR